MAHVRFEAYTPVPRRKLGYYALPLLWRDHVVGWANVSAVGGTLDVQCGYVAGRPPRDRGFTRALDAEIERLRVFLGVARLDKRKRRTGSPARGAATPARRRYFVDAAVGFSVRRWTRQFCASPVMIVLPLTQCIWCTQ